MSVFKCRFGGATGLQCPFGVRLARLPHWIRFLQIPWISIGSGRKLFASRLCI